MSDAHDGTNLAERYAGSVLSPDDGVRLMDAVEVRWVIAATLELSRARLDLLKTLQAGLPSEAVDGKEALTNVIIMQTRLNDREAGLVEALGSAGELRVERAEVLRLATAFVEAYEHVRDRALEGARGSED